MTLSVFQNVAIVVLLSLISVSARAEDQKLPTWCQILGVNVGLIRDPATRLAVLEWKYYHKATLPVLIDEADDIRDAMRRVTAENKLLWGKSFTEDGVREMGLYEAVGPESTVVEQKEVVGGGFKHVKLDDGREGWQATVDEMIPTMLNSIDALASVGRQKEVTIIRLTHTHPPLPVQQGPNPVRPSAFSIPDIRTSMLIKAYMEAVGFEHAALEMVLIYDLFDGKPGRKSFILPASLREGVHYATSQANREYIAKMVQRVKDFRKRNGQSPR